ncbi:MoaD/ThiS family protein [Pelagicoccus sp. SDUM812003]|uniref:MoaD/ThiS family protein n=1 Tax=Pelagicoccus sp. SDUM812003 TaxID=3041267 RepID=UPI00280F7DC3|nr:MoaD/ThiS family protein [Pelagicoccus sp. SDUM812003]MDQ8202309.1 MoaD/ThiS family protein [Pelagicoccus sp. SDUM812003]
MKVSIQYFALLREQRGLDQEEIDTDSATAGALYQELSERHGFTLPATSLKVALDDDFAQWDDRLSDGCSIVFIPPVAGG